MLRSRRPIPKAQIDEWIDRLLKLRDETDPADGEASAKGKTIKARSALAAYRALGNILVGWAVAHELGIAQAIKETYRPPALGNESSEKHKTLKDVVDKHEYELSQSGPLGPLGVPLADFDGPAARRVAIAMVQLSLAYDLELIEALSALDFGEVRPLLKPAPVGMHGANPYILAKHRLRATGHVAFFRGLGHGKEEALGLVADAYGTSPDTVKAWETRSPNMFGDFEVHDRLTWARAKGKQVADINKKLRPTDHDARVKKDALLRFGEEAVKLDGRKFKAALCQAKGKSGNPVSTRRKP